ncbi:MAG: AbrB/MazE/SpoVT family DNA-binding domain-containing protein [Candidatus Micrarchaeia archaeon]
MPVKKSCATCEHAIPNIEKRNMHFERKVSYSGKSLIISIPEDLARYMGVSKGSRVKVIPVNKKAFLVEVL